MGQILAMNSTDTVGVVIPAFNSASTIERALRSVSEQSVLPNEVVVVDDGSTDDTVQLIERFIRSTPQVKIRMINLGSNSGPAIARNTGWDACSTSLIAFLDSDDSWHPKKLELQLEVIRKHPEHVLFGHRYTVVNSENIKPDSPIGGTGELHYFTLRDFLIRNRLSTPTVIVRRSISQRFPLDHWGTEDFALWTSILARGNTAVVMDSVLTYLYKATYGQSGLSARLHEMHQGELRALRFLKQNHAIDRGSFILANLWMRLKYLRRLIRRAYV